MLSDSEIAMDQINIHCYEMSYTVDEQKWHIAI